jgi:YVTN family beta-propeller protein
VIAGSTDTVIATIPVGPHPFGVGLNPSTNKIYVANGNAVSVIDGATDSVTRRIPVHRSGPFGLAVNPITNKIYVANAGCCANLGGTVSVIDGATDTFVRTIPVGHKINPSTVAVNPATNKVYVTHLCPEGIRTGSECFADFAHELSVIDGSSDTVTTRVTVGEFPFGPVADSQRGKIYVPNVFSNTVSARWYDGCRHRRDPSRSGTRGGRRQHEHERGVRLESPRQHGVGDHSAVAQPLSIDRRPANGRRERLVFPVGGRIGAATKVRSLVRQP